MKRLAILMGLLIISFSIEGLSGEINQSLITGNAFKEASGIAGINIASGDNHIQSNMWIIGVESYNRGFITQEVCISNLPNETIDLIEDNAFSGVKGIFSVNQASGSGSAEANLVFFSTEEKVNTSTLDQNVAKIKNNSLYHGEFLDIISDSAFSGAKGIVQVNQSAGVGNAIANAFHLNLNEAGFK